MPSTLLDTRDAPGTPLAGGVVRELSVLGPNAPGTTQAVSLNVAVDKPAHSGFIRVYACDQPAPATSNVDFSSGETIANSVTTAISADGKVCLFSSTDTDVVVDLNGVWGPAAGDGLVAGFAPARLLDTRDGAGLPVAAGSVNSIPVAGVHGVPATASAVVLDVAADQPSAAGFLTVYPCGSPTPLASNLNYTAGTTIAARVDSAIGADGTVCVFSSKATHVVVDVEGAYDASDIATLLADFTPMRLLDTRDGTGSPATGGTVTEIAITGTPGMPLATAVVSLDIAADHPAADGFLTVYPCGAPTPLASNLNYTADTTIAGAATVAIGTGGKVCVFTSATTHLVIDVTATYAGAVG